MASKKVGEAIKKARTAAGLTQEQLARKVKGVSANDISLAERGEKELTQAVLKEIAKATGVTQTSLINAGKSTSKKTSSSSSSKKTSSSGTSMKLTATEKKLVELYREADSDTKKAAMNILKGEETNVSGDMLSSLLGNAINALGLK